MPRLDVIENRRKIWDPYADRDDGGDGCSWVGIVVGAVVVAVKVVVEEEVVVVGQRAAARLRNSQKIGGQSGQGLLQGCGMV